MNNDKLKDPRKMYYSGGYKEQDQAEPALHINMDPLPDCGEESYVGSGKLKGRNALITGGDSGIGRAVAIAYAREGANVAIQYVRGEENDALEVQRLIAEAGQDALLLCYDFLDDGAASEIVERTVEEFGSIDILVLNSAKQIARKNLQDFSIKEVEDVFKVNIISMFETVQAAEKYLEAGSTIITSTSIQSFKPSTDLLDYAATKSAISNFSVNLSQYFAEKGVRVNSVSPGPFWTPLQLNRGKLDGALAKFGQDTPLERAGQPVELSPVYVFLASDDSSYVTGQIYGVTGGRLMNL